MITALHTSGSGNEASPANIAGLSFGAISRLSAPALIDVIRAAELPSFNGVSSAGLAELDRTQLVRLANLARRFCRTRDAARSNWGTYDNAEQSINFGDDADGSIATTICSNQHQSR